MIKLLTIFYKDNIDPPESFVDRKNDLHAPEFKFATKRLRLNEDGAMGTDENFLVNTLVDIGTRGLFFPTAFDRDEYIPPHRIEKIYVQDVNEDG